MTLNCVKHHMHHIIYWLWDSAISCIKIDILCMYVSQQLPSCHPQRVSVMDPLNIHNSVFVGVPLFLPGSCFGHLAAHYGVLCYTLTCCCFKETKEKFHTNEKLGAKRYL